MALIKADTAYGRVVGQPTNFQSSTIFKGIPFAKPPVGDLRWEPPQPPEAWEGELKAFSYGNIPLQKRPDVGTFYRKEFYPIEWPSSEDCLYLNIVTPAETPDEKLPVAFWIYGGGFIQGYSQKVETDGEAFAEKGVIYVSVNYRVGPFGFMSCPTFDAQASGQVSGNLGLLDQIAALDWVRENIAAFGGDPDRITIFGQSAGAMSVYSLLLSPLTKGKIAGAIMESGGGPISSMVDLPGVRSYCEEFVQSLGTSSYEELKSLDATKLMQAWLAFGDAHGGIPPLSTSWPNVTMPTDPDSALRAKTYANVPCMIGSMADENSLIGAQDTTDINLTMRNTFLGGVIGFAENQAYDGGAPVYAYHVTNVPPGEPNCGAFHSSEHMYIFKTLNRSWRPYTGKDYDFAEIMCTYWTNFIKTGNPNGEELSAWTPYNQNNKRFMKLDREGCGMINVPEYDGVAKAQAEEALGRSIKL